MNHFVFIKRKKLQKQSSSSDSESCFIPAQRKLRPPESFVREFCASAHPTSVIYL